MAAIALVSSAFGRDLPGLLAVEPVLTPAAEFVETPGLREISRVETASGPRLEFQVISSDRPESRWLQALSRQPAIRRLRSLLGETRRLSREQGRQAPAPDSPLLVALPKKFREVGPAYCYALPARATDSDGREALEVPGFLLIAPLRTPQGTFRVRDMEAAGFLTASLVHEVFHALMAEAYGPEYLKLKALADPFTVHESPVVTDPATALVEGLAEAAEVVLEAAYPGQVYTETSTDLAPEQRTYARSLRRRRVTAVEHGRYVYRADGRTRDGVLDAGRDLVRTEGVVAHLTSALLPHLGSQDGLDILVRALVHETPRSFTALIQALQRQVPEALPAIQRTLLEFTRYALFSPGAAPRYQRVYQAKLDFLRGRISKQQYQDEKTSWQAWRQEQRQRIEAGATLMATVVDPIEVLTLSGLSLDLNGDPESLVSGIEGLLKEMGSSDPALAHPDRVLARILRSREHRGGRFEDMKDLREVLPQELFEVLCEGNRRAQAEIEARLEAVARRLGQRRLRDSFVVEPDPRFFTGSVSETSPASWDR